jgi:hypothetical protein
LKLDIIAPTGDGGSMSYPGGKQGSGSYQTIINLMPPHRVYIEPFLGGGAVLLSKRPAEINIGIERDRAALEMVVTPAASAAWIRAGKTGGYGRG